MAIQGELQEHDFQSLTHTAHDAIPLIAPAPDVESGSREVPYFALSGVDLVRHYILSGRAAVVGEMGEERKIEIFNMFNGARLSSWEGDFREIGIPEDILFLALDSLEGQFIHHPGEQGYEGSERERYDLLPADEKLQYLFTRIRREEFYQTISAYNAAFSEDQKYPGPRSLGMSQEEQLNFWHQLESLRGQEGFQESIEGPIVAQLQQERMETLESIRQAFLELREKIGSEVGDRISGFEWQRELLDETIEVVTLDGVLDELWDGVVHLEGQDEEAAIESARSGLSAATLKYDLFIRGLSAEHALDAGISEKLGFVKQLVGIYVKYYKDSSDELPRSLNNIFLTYFFVSKLFPEENRENILRGFGLPVDINYIPLERAVDEQAMAQMNLSDVFRQFEKIGSPPPVELLQ